MPEIKIIPAQFEQTLKFQFFRAENRVSLPSGTLKRNHISFVQAMKNGDAYSCVMKNVECNIKTG